MLMPAVAMVVALSACGSDTESAEPAIDEVVTTESAEEAATTEAPTTTAPPTTEAPTTETSEAEASDDVADSEYCQLTRAADELDATFDSFDDPVALEAYLVDLTDLLGQAVDVAPTEIAADLEIIQAQIEEVVVITADSGYDFSAMLAAVTNTSNEVNDTATLNVDEYDETYCRPATGVDDTFGVELTVESFESARETEAMRDLMISGMIEGREVTEEQAGCFIDEVSPELFVTLGNNGAPDEEQIDELFELLATCDIPVSTFTS